jgi:nucleoside-diphosphate-sugar epimerase
MGNLYAHQRLTWPGTEKGSVSGMQLVTGGSGYFGSLLVEQLRKRGQRVRVLDLNDADDRPDDVEFCQGDIRDPAAVGRACQGIDVIHHNVAQVPLAKDRQAFWSVNVDGTRVLLDACRKAAVQKVVSMSSSAVYGVPARNPVDDMVAPKPGEEYGRAKLAAEGLCRSYAERGLDITVIRPRTIVGMDGSASCRSSSNGCVRAETSRSLARERISISSSMPMTSRTR